MCGFGWASGPRESEVFCGAPPPPRGHREVLRPPGLPLSSGTALAASVAAVDTDNRYQSDLNRCTATRRAAAWERVYYSIVGG